LQGNGVERNLSEERGEKRKNRKYRDDNNGETEKSERRKSLR
jgi:hypothetical protein